MPVAPSVALPTSLYMKPTNSLRGNHHGLVSIFESKLTLRLNLIFDSLVSHQPALDFPTVAGLAHWFYYAQLLVGVGLWNSLAGLYWSFTLHGGLFSLPFVTTGALMR